MFRKSVVALGAVLGLGAQAASPNAAPTTGPTAGSAAGFEARFAPLYAAVFSEGGSFSGNAMSRDLQALEPLLHKAKARDAFRLYYTEASVYGRRDMPAEAANAAQKALAALPAVDATHAAELAYPQFFLRHSSIRWLADAGNYAQAVLVVKQFQQEYPLSRIAQLPAQMRWSDDKPVAKAMDFPTQTQILGVYEDEGYLLHEQKKYREALQANQRLLPVARERLQALGQPELLRGLLTNLAQNSYELGELEQARGYLQQRLDIALKAQEHETIYDCYFQLMVLAHEQGQHQQAQQWLAAYERHAKNHPDSAHLERSQQLGAELASRASQRSKL